MDEELTYEERMAKIADMIKDCMDKKGYVCRISLVESSSSIGYDLHGVYVCEKEQYRAEFGDDEE